MNDESTSLDDPKQIRNAKGERRDGRPTGGEAGESGGVPHEAAPTVAPEEEGLDPSTEHAPGGDL